METVQNFTSFGDIYSQSVSSDIIFTGRKFMNYSLPIGVGSHGLALKFTRNESHPEDLGSGSVSPGTIVGLSLLFFVICVVGICGNSFVVCAVVCNKKMRTSMTNLLITNLAFADLLIMVFGIPETILFMLDQGWLFNRTACKVNRYVMVTSLYGSVLTLIALCVERWGNAFIWSQTRNEILKVISMILFITYHFEWNSTAKTWPFFSSVLFH